MANRCRLRRAFTTGLITQFSTLKLRSCLPVFLRRYCPKKFHRIFIWFYPFYVSLLMRVGVLVLAVALCAKSHVESI